MSTSSKADGAHVLYVVNAFSCELTGGNAAAVCVLPPTFRGFHDADATKEFQKIAAVMNYSETAFLIPAVPGTEHSSAIKDASLADSFHLRWFTPTSEVPLCGHATLASAFAIFSVFGNENTKITFHTKSGPLVCRRGTTQPHGNQIIMDFPQYAFEPVSLNDEPWKSIASLTVNGAKISDAVFAPASGMLLLTLDPSSPMSVLTSLKPDLAGLMRACPDGTVKGVCVTRVAEKGAAHDFCCRYFGPWVGIDEDPVTGSVHSLLGPYWAKKFNKTNLQSRQCSSRGGDLWLHLRDDGRIDITGSACLSEKRTLVHADAIRVFGSACSS